MKGETSVRLYHKKWVRFGAAATFGAFALGLTLLYVFSNSRLNREYEIPDRAISVPTDKTAITRGAHLVQALAGCTDCHGHDLSGDLLYDDPLFGQIAASNLTPGQGGIGLRYSDADWVRAIRNGVGPDGKPLLFVMSRVYNNYGDDDLAAMIAYLKNVPAIDNQLPATRAGLLSRIFILIDPSLLPAQVIDHDAERSPAPVPGVTAEYGRYLAFSCTICHGENFAGGLSVGAGLNLTPGGDLGNWTQGDFVRALRTGDTPEGRRLNPESMPWRRLKLLSDEELQAIWLHLQSLPAVEVGEP